MKRLTFRALAGFFLISQLHIEVFAQQDGDDQQADSETINVIQRYGRNAANNLGSVIATPDSVPLLRDYSPVTDEVLQNPPDSDWLTWRRTYNNLGFSNLDQINRETVSNLQLAWHQPVTPGNNMPTPLVHDGIMFLYSAFATLYNNNNNNNK